MAPREINWSDLDWRAYQKLVAGLHADENTEVETEYEYPIYGGGTKEVDVVVWDSSNQYEYTVLIECKFTSKPVPKSVVDSVNGYFQNSDADKAVIISKSGFQSGAIERARGTGVELLTLREFIPRTDLPVDALRYMNFNLDVINRDVEILSIETESLEDPDDKQKIGDHAFTPLNSQFYTISREPLRETLHDRILNLKESKSVGEHREEFDKIAILIQGEFFQLKSMDYLISESTTKTEFTVDLFEEVDSLYRNELTDDEEYESLSDALSAFREHTKEDGN